MEGGAETSKDVTDTAGEEEEGYEVPKRRAQESCKREQEQEQGL